MSRSIDLYINVYTNIYPSFCIFHSCPEVPPASRFTPGWPPTLPPLACPKVSVRSWPRRKLPRPRWTGWQSPSHIARPGDLMG